MSCYNKLTRIRYNTGISVNGTPSGSGSMYSTPSGSGSMYSTPSGSGSMYSTPSGSGSMYSTPSGSGSMYSTPSGSGMGGDYNNETFTDEELKDFIDTFEQEYDPHEMNKRLYDIALDQSFNSNSPLTDIEDEDELQHFWGQDAYYVESFLTMLGIDQEDSRPMTNIHTLGFTDLVKELQDGYILGSERNVVDGEFVGYISSTTYSEFIFQIFRRYIELQFKHYIIQNMSNLEVVIFNKDQCENLSVVEKSSCMLEIDQTLDEIKGISNIFNKLILIMNGSPNSSLVDKIREISPNLTSTITPHIPLSLEMPTTSPQNPYINLSTMETPYPPQPQSLTQVSTPDPQPESTTIESTTPDPQPPTPSLEIPLSTNTGVTHEIEYTKEDITHRNYMIIGLFLVILLLIYRFTKK